MEYNIYKLSDDFVLLDKQHDEVGSYVHDKLKILEDQLVHEYLKKQKGKLGIKNLGNEIRRNTILKTLFSSSTHNSIFIKMTENKRSFLNVFLNKWKEFNTSILYYIILENDFGRNSQIVDASFIRIKDINVELSSFSNFFGKKTHGPDVYFIEIKGFSNHIIVDKQGFSSIIKNT